MRGEADTGRARFISEPIEPDRDTFDTDRAARGEPGLPRKFTWRGEEYRIVEVLTTWKTTGPCSSGSPEKYVRKHWHRVRTENGDTMTLYCSRQPSRRAGKIKGGWVLYSITEQEG
jgi:hypothetical protein